MATSGKEDDTTIARYYIDSIFSNKWEFDDKINNLKKTSPIMSYCGAFHSFMRATLLFESERLNKAYQDLNDCQSLCKEPTTMVKFLKNSFTYSLGMLNFSANKYTQITSNQKDRFFKDIIIADCKLYSSTLQFMNYDGIASIITAALELRKAWKIYEFIHTRIYTRLKTIDPNFEREYMADPNKFLEVKINQNDTSFSCDDDTVDDKSEVNLPVNSDISEMSIQDLKSILAGVCYGYGIVQLCFSFLPPYLIPIIRFLGFQGDRVAAITALHYASESNDIRSSFADVVLISYSTIGIQFIGYNEIDMFLNKEEVEKLVEKNLKNNENSWLFLYLKAKYYHICCKNSKKGLEYLQLTKSNATGLKEIDCLVGYESGFIYLSNLNYEKAWQSFSVFTKLSKWSQSLNTYVKIILNGCLNNMENIEKDLKAISGVVNRKTPIELFACNRIDYLNKRVKISRDLCIILAIELVYSWLFMSLADHESLNKIIEILSSESEEHDDLKTMKCLIIGSIYYEMKNIESAKKYIKKSIDDENDTKGLISYVNPHAYCYLCCICLDEDDIDNAKGHLRLAKEKTNYDFKDRLQGHMRSLERRIEHKSNRNIN